MDWYGPSGRRLHLLRYELQCSLGNDETDIRRPRKPMQAGRGTQVRAARPAHIGPEGTSLRTLRTLRGLQVDGTPVLDRGRTYTAFLTSLDIQLESGCNI